MLDLTFFEGFLAGMAAAFVVTLIIDLIHLHNTMSKMEKRLEKL